MPRQGSLRIDHEKLAWAAGFFDGEGSTFAKADGDRPGYHQLVVAVPQAGVTTPAVLERFQKAMLGMGRIDAPTRTGTHKWRSRGFVDAQQTLILLWPNLGEVKRVQAAAAMRTVARQYATGTYRPRPAKSRPDLVQHRVSRVAEPLRLERAWAAGFFDAEGCVGLARNGRRSDGTARYRIRASASQKGRVAEPPAVLLRLKRALGGMGRIERHGDPDDFKWLVEGLPGVREILATIGPWLGTVKREQASAALDDFLDQRRIRGARERCIRGHAYDRRMTLENGRSRGYCNACARLLSRRGRARQGIAPRQFRDVNRRYTE